VSVDRGQSKLEAPLDFAIVVAWRAIMGALLRQRVDADLLRLVHLSNSYRVLDQTAPLTEGDVCETSAEVTKMQVRPIMCIVAVLGDFFPDGGSW
jgi:fatty acid synthase subunit beta